MNNQLNESPDMNIYKVWLKGKGKDGDMFGMLVEAVDERDAVDILALLMNVEHPHDAVVQLVEDGTTSLVILLEGKMPKRSANRDEGENDIR